MVINKQENLSDNKIAKEFLKTFEDIAQKVVDRESQSFLKQSPAKVIGYEKKDDIVYVTFIDDANANCYTYRNCTGANLNVDDIVNIIYTKNRAKGTLINKLGENDLSDDCIGEWSDKGKNSVVIINTDKPNTIDGDNGFCAGKGNRIKSDDCFCIGVDNTIENYTSNSICIGCNNYINNGSERDDIQGHDGCIIGGKNNKLFGSGDFIGGGLSNTTSKSCSAVMGGCGNKVSADYGYIGGGYRNIIKESPYSSITGGYDNEIDYWTSYGILAHRYNHIGSGHANKIKASDYSAIIGGKSNRLSFTESTIVLGGDGLTNQNLLLNLNGNYFSRHLVMCGSYNKNFANTQQLFEIGNGISDNSRSNAFRVTNDGNIYAGAAVNSTGADFAEMREWSDGNPNSEDRRGLFVVYDDSIDYKIGEYAKIRIANENDDLDDVLGIISSNPTVVGNTASETWQGMWQRDIFGNVITEEKYFSAETNEIENPETGEKEAVVVIPEHTETVPVVNPMYDGTKEYIGRKDRPEWGVVGMLGMVVTVDDGSCKMLKYCKVGQDGKATHSENKTRFRVVARLDETHIAVEIR